MMSPAKALGDFLLLVGVHHHHAADAFLLALWSEVTGGASPLSFIMPKIDPGEGERAHEGVVHDLERQPGKGLRVIGRPRPMLRVSVLVAGVKTMLGRHVPGGPGR